LTGETERDRAEGLVALAPVADLRRAWELKLSNTVVADLLGGSPQNLPDRYRSTSPIELVPLGVSQRVMRRPRRYRAVGDQPPVFRRREKKRRRFEIDRSSGAQDTSS
jgi:hypothetical protein